MPLVGLNLCRDNETVLTYLSALKWAPAWSRGIDCAGRAQGRCRTRETAPGDTSLHKIVGIRGSLSNNLVHNGKRSRLRSLNELLLLFAFTIYFYNLFCKGKGHSIIIYNTLRYAILLSYIC